MSPAARRSMLFYSLGGLVLCSSLYTFLDFSSPGFQTAFSLIRRSTPISTTATPEIISVVYKENAQESYVVVEEPTCTVQQGSYQASNYCSIFMGRHNLKPFFTLIRFHMPDATLLVDIGANKGLVSSRWLELWRPELNHSAIEHVKFVKQYVKDNAPKGTDDLWCGVTNMCDKPNLVERAFLDQYAPVTTHNRDNTTEPFEIYSFEPSPHLHQMQQYYMATHASDSLRAVWKWFPYAASDEVKEVYFHAKWNEGSKIETKNLGMTTNTTIMTVTLDSLAQHRHHDHYQTNGSSLSGIEQHVDSNPSLFGNRTIDVLKIDAEGVDAAVLVGASRLLRDERIRVVMWELPNVYPLQFPDWFGGVAIDFGALIDRLDKHASMSCYIPGRDSKMIKLTKCWDRYLSNAQRCNKLPIYQSNAICVSRTKAGSLYRTLEAKALIHQAPTATAGQ